MRRSPAQPWWPALRRRLRTPTTEALAAAVLIAGGGLYVTGRHPSDAPKAPPRAVLYASVVRTTVQARDSVNAIVGFQGSYTVVNQLGGIYTTLPDVGSVVREGQALYMVGTASDSTHQQLLDARSQLALDEASLASAEGASSASAGTTAALRLRIQADQDRVLEDQAAIATLSVIAPTTEVVLGVDVTAGEPVDAGQPILTYADTSDVVVTVDVPAFDLKEIDVGSPATVETAFSGNLAASVASVGGNSAGTVRGEAVFPVTVLLTSPPTGLDPGMSTTVYLAGAQVAANGTLAFPDQITAKAPAPGTVQTVSASTGEVAAQGTILATLASPAAQAQLVSDQAQLAADEAQLTSDASPSNGASVASLRASVAADTARVAALSADVANAETPVILLKGDTPAYRTLAPGESGPDVAQLNADLEALGYAPAGTLTKETYTAATAAAVRNLQLSLSEAATGSIAWGQVVFEPTALRVTSVTPTPGVGAASGQTVLLASSATTEVIAQVDPSLASDLKVGDPVLITLPYQSKVTGTVTHVATVATSSSPNSPPTIEVDAVARKGGSPSALDGATVEVGITTATVRQSLAVPINALLARGGGKYDVEVVAAGHSRFIPVRVGIFDDAQGLVEVRGPGLHAGQRVVVAGT